MKPHVLGMLALLSSLLFLAGLALCVRSELYNLADGFSYKRSEGPVISREIIAWNSNLGLELFVKINVDLRIRNTMSSYGFWFPGLDYDAASGPKAYECQISIKRWLALVATGVAPLLWLLLRVQRLLKRRKPGLCPTCGYDLCATPARCPECGTVAHGRP